MSRRSGRRERREQKRRQNKKDYKIEDIATNDALYRAFKKSCKGVMFKESVQRYRLNLFFKNYETKQKLLKGEDIRMGLIKFKRSDRGKTRDIQSLHFGERLAQTALCRDVLQPGFFKTLIKENSASQKGKGTLFASKLFEQHLREFLLHHNIGYILFIDFSKYFENIDQEVAVKFYEKNIKDDRLRKLCSDFVTVYDKGLGLGSEVSQFNAIIYLNYIDHWVKSKFKYYGRYMDDSYIIFESKEELEATLKILLDMYAELKIIVNPKKTKIIPISQPFTFLKTRYRVKNKKIIKKPDRSSITRERKRIRGQVRLYNKGEMTKDAIDRSVVSWKGSMKRRHARKTVYEIEKYYKKQIERG